MTLSQVDLSSEFICEAMIMVVGFLMAYYTQQWFKMVAFGPCFIAFILGSFH